MQEINSMMKPVIMDQHGQLYIFEDRSELEEWKKIEANLSMIEDAFEFDCLNDFRNYLNRMRQALSNIESTASDALLQ